MTLRAPFPWFGGKSLAAHLIWPRFGEVKNYVEPFAGSLAVLLARPEHISQTETVNDLDAYLCNFWRAVQTDPEAVARHANWPVSEADLHARHVWLLKQGDFRERMLIDPHYYDAQIAGWWVWGISSWIGSGWCDLKKAPGRRTNERTNATLAPTAAPLQSGHGRPHRKIPELGSERGVRRASFQNWPRHEVCTDRPTDRPGPLASSRHSATSCAASLAGLGGIFDLLADRFRRVRITCGQWDRVLGPSVTSRHGVTAILLDPPYPASTHAITYAARGGDVGLDVRAWAIAHGADPMLRIALCGYIGERDMPRGWTRVRWKARGGYGSQGTGRGRANAAREVIWFSRSCLKAIGR